MSIQKDVWVKCDECGEMGFASHTSKQARREARENGWVFRSGKDYCPNCAPTKRTPDATPQEPPRGMVWKNDEGLPTGV